MVGVHAHVARSTVLSTVVRWSGSAVEYIHGVFH